MSTKKFIITMLILFGATSFIIGIDLLASIVHLLEACGIHDEFDINLRSEISDVVFLLLLSNILFIIALLMSKFIKD